MMRGMAQRFAARETSKDVLSGEAEFKPHAPVIERNERGQFLTGHKQVSPGRPKGSRNKVAETFLADLLEVWELHGREALIACAQTDPARFCAITAATLPKDYNVGLDVTLNQARDALGAYRMLQELSRKQLEDLRNGAADPVA
jgi:hypothetical protein